MGVALLDRSDFTEADAEDHLGRNALHVAASYGHVSPCIALVKHSRFTKACVKDKKGQTALDIVHLRQKDGTARDRSNYDSIADLLNKLQGSSELAPALHETQDHEPPP